jgi:quercetin dioxygenase-like cupin family protein
MAVLDIAPNPTGAEGPMHRTNTIDYIVILEGELEFSLNDGEKRIFRKGDIVIERACWHAWKNTSKTEAARMIAFVVGGKGAVEGAGAVELPPAA